MMEEETPPKKKSKPSFHDAVRTYLNDGGRILKSKDVCLHTKHVEITESQNDDNDLDEVMVSQ